MNKERRLTTISLNKEEVEFINKESDRLGIEGMSTTLKVLAKLGSKHLDEFEDRFSNVITPLKYTEIDYLISSLRLKAKQHKKDKQRVEGLKL
jgi:uncharacterized protein YutD